MMRHSFTIIDYDSHDFHCSRVRSWQLDVESLRLDHRNRMNALSPSPYRISVNGKAKLLNDRPFARWMIPSASLPVLPPFVISSPQRRSVESRCVQCPTWVYSGRVFYLWLKCGTVFHACLYVRDRAFSVSDLSLLRASVEWCTVPMSEHKAWSFIVELQSSCCWWSGGSWRPQLTHHAVYVCECYGHSNACC